MGVFDQIKSAFGKDDAGSRKTVKDSIAEKAPPDVATEKTYTVQSGDTLWKIAEDKLGEGNRYTEIFEANRDVLESPDHILPGQELKIP